MRKFAILALVLMTGCTSLTDLKRDISERMFGVEPTDPPMPLATFTEAATATVAWRLNVGPSETYDFIPAVDGGAVFAASAAGEVSRVDLASGKQAWRVSVGEPLSGGVGAGSNLVVAGTPSGMVVALDQSGKLLWKSKVSSEVLSAPQVAKDIVVVRSGDSRIYGLSVADGKRKWVYDRVTPSLTLRSSAGVLVVGDNAYVGFAGGKLISLRISDGSVLWEASVALPKGVTEIERIADITSLPAVEDNMVYAVAYQGRVAGVDRTTGRIAWTRDISSFNGLSVDDGRIFVSHSGGAVYALDEGSGRSFWRQGGLLNRLLSAPVNVGRYIAVGDLEGYVHYLSVENGAFAARVRLDESTVMRRMTVADDNVVVAQTRSGGLYAVRLK